MDNCKCTPAPSLAEQVMELNEFVELVAKMRSAQLDFALSEDHKNLIKETVGVISDDLYRDWGHKYVAMRDAEEQVDNYLKSKGY